MRRIRQLSGTETVSLLSWLGALGTLRYRIPYGVCHTDEAFYSALPYSFLIGNRPYLDERTVHQNAGILLVPLYRLYLAIAGSSDGIILFNRYLYLTYVAVASLLTWRLVRRIANFSSGCWAAALLVCFGYFNLFTLGYNMMGALGFICGVLLSAHALLGARPGRELFVANLFFLSAIFSYPALFIVLLPYNLAVVAWLYWKCPSATMKSGLFGLGSALLAALAIFVPFAFWFAGPRYERVHGLQVGQGYGLLSGLSRLDFYHSPAWGWRPALLAFSALFVLVPLACRWLQRGVWLVAPLSALSCLACYRLGFDLGAITKAMFFFMAIPVLAPVCVALNREWPHGRFLLVLVWAPSVLSMLVSTYSSGNGWFAALLGALGAVISGVAAFGALLEARAASNVKAGQAYQFVLIAFAGACLALEVHSMFAYVYSQTITPFASHDTRVKSGPMRGTIGTSAHAEFAETIHRDLKDAAEHGQTLTIFDSFPSGYLSTKLRPKTWSLWIIWGIPVPLRKQLMAETFGDPAQLPELVLKIGIEPESKPLWPKYERGHYHKLLERKEFGYVIMQRNDLRAK
ncbi:MAG TPA: hypothetical protein VER96_18905 [Polyangiaceae bacterium]|nr:hypothetical protein [Polyangiaceae bacterium]